MRLFKPPEIDPVPEDLPGIHAYVSETLRMTNELWDMVGVPWKWLAWHRLHAQIKARNAAAEAALDAAMDKLRDGAIADADAYAFYAVPENREPVPGSPPHRR